MRAITIVLDLILRYRLEIQLCPVETITPYFIFTNHYHGGIPQGAELPLESHKNKLTHCQCLLSPKKVKQALEILSLSTSNLVFGGSNLMIATSQALAHGFLLLDSNTYGDFNLIDFSSPPS